MGKVKGFFKKHKWTLVKIGAGTGIAAIAAYAGYKYALHLEDVIDMRDEKQVQLVNNVMEEVQELGGIAQVKFIRKYMPDIASSIEKFLDEHPEIQDKYPAITYDLAKGCASCKFEDVEVGKF